MKVLRDLFTGADGSTYDMGRVLWFLACLAPVGTALAQMSAAFLLLFRERVYLPLWGASDWVVWAGGVSGLLVAGAGALAMKRQTEPQGGNNA